MHTIKYIPAAKEHVAQMLGIASEALPDSEDCEGSDFFLPYIRAGQVIVAMEGKKVIGYVIYDDNKDKFVHVISIAVHHGYRRRGVGSQLLKFVTELCSDVKANVREMNLPAQLFFKRNAFMVFDVLKNSYENSDEDCYVFTLYAGTK